jgi:hypothetical protein
VNNISLVITIAQLLLLALTFIIIPLVGQKYGRRAQNAAEKAVADQGLEPGILLKNGVKMTESKVEMLLPFAFALAYLIVAIITLVSGQINHTLLWIIEGFTFLVVGAVTAQQVFIASFLTRAFKNAKDEHLHKVNVKQFITAAQSEFPSWLHGVQVMRFVLATAGSLVILALLFL